MALMRKAMKTHNFSGIFLDSKPFENLCWHKIAEYLYNLEATFKISVMTDYRPSCVLEFELFRW